MERLEAELNYKLRDAVDYGVFPEFPGRYPGDFPGKMILFIHCGLRAGL